jgi:hypothetical protein
VIQVKLLADNSSWDGSRPGGVHPGVLVVRTEAVWLRLTPNPRVTASTGRSSGGEGHNRGGGESVGELHSLVDCEYVSGRLRVVTTYGEVVLGWVMVESGICVKEFEFVR